MKNIFRKKSGDNDKYKMEWQDYAFAVFITLVLLALFYFLTDNFL